MKTDIKTEIVSMQKQAGAVVVTNPEQYQIAGGFLAAVKGLLKKVDEAFDPIIKAASDAHKKALAVKREHQAPLLDAETAVNQRMVTYRAEEQRRQAAEEARLLREAEEKAKMDQAMEVAIAEAAGDFETAKEIQAAPVAVAPVVIEKPDLKVEGLQVRKTWGFRIVDATRIPREYLVPDEKAIGGVVRAMKQATNIPGVAVFEEEKIGRSGR